MRFTFASEVDALLQLKSMIVIGGHRVTLARACNASSSSSFGKRVFSRVSTWERLAPKDREKKIDQTLGESSKKVGGEVSWPSGSGTFYREALMGGPKACLLGDKGCPFKIRKFSYIEGTTKAWMNKNVVAQRKVRTNVRILKNLIEASGVEV